MKLRLALFLASVLSACSPGAPSASRGSAPAAAAGQTRNDARKTRPRPAPAPRNESGCTAARREELLSLLRTYDADGWRVYQTEQRRGTKTQEGKLVFDAFFDEGCAAGEAADEVLSTAVHESVHALRSALGGYDLIGGSLLADLPENRDLFAPGKMLGDFGGAGADPFVENYLGPDQATSAADFTFLLDELNAYAHDLTTSSRLDGHFAREGGSRTTPRDGTLALLSFVKRYAEVARASSPRAWSVLQGEPFRSAVRTLWKQSEDALAESCRHEGQGSEIGEKYLKGFCDPATSAGIAALLGRAPLCPSRCL